MPGGIPYIIGNEAAERFSFYGMKAILSVFMIQYLHFMGASPAEPLTQAEVSARFHLFSGLVYLTPFLGALLADIVFGKYRVIIWLSLVYCLGHAFLAMMGTLGSPVLWLNLGLAMIILGSGGIKPCVSAHVGDQFGPNNQHLMSRVFNWFYWSINLGAAASMFLTPVLLNRYGPHWAFGVPGVLMAVATLFFWLGRRKFIHVPAGEREFVRELVSPDHLPHLGKLAVVYFIFVAMFWALF
ncbi:MAG: MFS transporter, partial [Verrucomicrobiota bacterium]